MIGYSKFNVNKEGMLLVNKRCMFTPLTISNLWKHTKILPTNINVELTEIPNTNSVPTSGELTQAVNDLNLPDSLPIDEFLNHPEKERTYEVPDNNTLIEVLIEIYKQSCIDDSVEPPIVNVTMLHQQDYKSC